MKYYYQIKGKKSDNSNEYNFSNWSFPPIFSGCVEAINKKQAKELIEDEYNKKFPLRVLTKDLDSNDFLLNISEFNDSIERLFADKICVNCENIFKQIDLYNNSFETYKGCEYCSGECKNIVENERRNNYYDNINLLKNHQPVIYKITNKITNMVYIGKTTQAFTFRWYQHFYQNNTNSKFYTAVNNSKLSDWIFEVIEEVEIINENKDDVINKRERYWIEFYDSINNGYNSL